MELLLDIGAMVAGLAIGGAVGYWIGSTWREDRRTLWAIAIAAFMTASILNFAGLISARQWLAIGAVGLMAGIITGVKYGGFPETRAWEKPPEDTDTK